MSQRWDCTENILIQLCESNKIEIGTNLSQTYAREEISVNHLNKSILIEGFFVLSIKDIKRINNLLPTVVRTVYESKKNSKLTGDNKTKQAFLLKEGETMSSEALVITKTERDRFEKEFKVIIHDNEIIQEPVDKTTHPREKKNLLRVIKALCYKANIDVDHSTKAAETIIRIADKAGIKTPARNTIANWLKEFPDD